MKVRKMEHPAVSILQIHERCLCESRQDVSLIATSEEHIKLSNKRSTLSRTYRNKVKFEKQKIKNKKDQDLQFYACHIKSHFHFPATTQVNEK